MKIVIIVITRGGEEGGMKMEATREELKAEAINRMKALGLFEGYIKDFAITGRVQESEGPLGALYYVNDDTQAKINDLEEKYNGLVYAAIHHHLGDDECYALLWVSSEKDEWEYEHDDITEGLVLAYVWNKGYDIGSEFGLIKVELTVGAGLRRVA